MGLSACKWFICDGRTIRIMIESDSSVSLVPRIGGNGIARKSKSYNIGGFYNLVDNSSNTRMRYFELEVTRYESRDTYIL